MKDDYYIDEITYKSAMHLIIKHHYLHRKSNCVYSFGLIRKETKEIVGVITYGIPASPNVCRGICGKDEEKNVYELTRLWIKDDVPKNAESYLIGNTLKLLDREIVVSYSEPEQGHVGTVYQATNFLYCGLTAKRTNRVKIDGTKSEKHNRHMVYDKDNTVLVPRPRKHRYIYLNCKGKRKKELLNKLLYKILPYPKKN